MDKVTIPSHIESTLCVTFFSDRVILQQRRKRFPGTDEFGQIVKPAGFDRRGQSEASRENLKKKGSGTMSYHTRLSIRRAASIFMMGRVRSKSNTSGIGKSSYLNASFITLTIPGMEEVFDSKRGYEKLIGKVVEYIKYNYGVRDYLWRFEWQGRGQGHWHIMADKWIYDKGLREYWMKLIRELGAGGNYQNSDSYDPSSSCKIQGIKTENSLAGYFWEYFFKCDQSVKPTKGRWWGASNTIRKAALPVFAVGAALVDKVGRMGDSGLLDVYDVEVESKQCEEISILRQFKKPSFKKVCTVIKKGRSPLLSLFCDIELSVIEEYKKCYRAGNWEASQALAAKLIGNDAKHAMFISEQLEISRELRVLKSLTIIPKVVKSRLTKRRRLNIKRKLQRDELLRKQAGVSLFT